MHAWNLTHVDEMQYRDGSQDEDGAERHDQQRQARRGVDLARMPNGAMQIVDAQQEHQGSNDADDSHVMRELLGFIKGSDHSTRDHLAIVDDALAQIDPELARKYPGVAASRDSLLQRRQQVIADNYTTDTREWPDPTEPRPSQPPVQDKCTCPEGLKLECPVHGLHATQPDLDHSWSIPEGSPVGYPQDQPRGWTQAVSSRGQEREARNDEQQRHVEDEVGQQRPRRASLGPDGYRRRDERPDEERLAHLEASAPARSRMALWSIRSADDHYHEEHDEQEHRSDANRQAPEPRAEQRADAGGEGNDQQREEEHAHRLPHVVKGKRETPPISRGRSLGGVDGGARKETPAPSASVISDTAGWSFTTRRDEHSSSLERRQAFRMPEVHPEPISAHPGYQPMRDASGRINDGRDALKGSGDDSRDLSQVIEPLSEGGDIVNETLQPHRTGGSIDRQRDEFKAKGEALGIFDGLSQGDRPDLDLRHAWRIPKMAQTPAEELSGALTGMDARTWNSPNNPLNSKDPSANPSNPNFNPDLPGSYNNPSNPELNPYLPGSQTNPSNPMYNPSNPGAQNNPSNPEFNPAFPNAQNNPANPNLNPALPGSFTNPANPINNPDLPQPGNNPRPEGVSPDASLPPSYAAWDLSALAIGDEPSTQANRDPGNEPPPLVIDERIGSELDAYGTEQQPSVEAYIEHGSDLNGRRMLGDVQSVAQRLGTDGHDAEVIEVEVNTQHRSIVPHSGRSVDHLAASKAEQELLVWGFSGHDQRVADAQPDGKSVISSDEVEIPAHIHARPAQVGGKRQLSDADKMSGSSDHSAQSIRRFIKPLHGQVGVVEVPIDVAAHRLAQSDLGILHQDADAGQLFDDGVWHLERRSDLVELQGNSVKEASDDGQHPEVFGISRRDLIDGDEREDVVGQIGGAFRESVNVSRIDHAWQLSRSARDELGPAPAEQHEGRKDEEIGEGQGHAQSIAALDYQPGRHPYRERGMRMQQPGRGIIAPDGSVHTWPENEGEHEEKARVKGYEPDQCHSLYIRPNGETVIGVPWGDTPIDDQTAEALVQQAGLTPIDPAYDELERTAGFEHQMWHLAPKDKREQIMAEGLRTHAPEDDPYAQGDPAVYLWHKPKAPGFYGDDLYRVNVQGLTPQLDEGESNASFLPHDIEPGRIQHVPDWQNARDDWDEWNWDANRRTSSALSLPALGAATNGSIDVVHGWKLSRTSERFHVAPTIERERIRQHGLQPTDPADNWAQGTWENGFQPPKGVYAWPSAGHAYDYRDQLTRQRDQSHDIWAIPGGGKWRTDPDAEGAQYSTEPMMNAYLHDPVEEDSDALGLWPHEDFKYGPTWQEQHELNKNRNVWGIGRPDRVIGSGGEGGREWDMSPLPPLPTHLPSPPSPSSDTTARLTRTHARGDDRKPKEGYPPQAIWSFRRLGNVAEAAGDLGIGEAVDAGIDVEHESEDVIEGCGFGREYGHEVFDLLGRSPSSMNGVDLAEQLDGNPLPVRESGERSHIARDAVGQIGEGIEHMPSRAFNLVASELLGDHSQAEREHIEVGHGLDPVIRLSNAWSFVGNISGWSHGQHDSGSEIAMATPEPGQHEQGIEQSHEHAGSIARWHASAKPSVIEGVPYGSRHKIGHREVGAAIEGTSNVSWDLNRGIRDPDRGPNEAHAWRVLSWTEADPNLYYHQAPTEDRERVRAHGLIPGRPRFNPHWEGMSGLQDQPQGVYVGETANDTMQGARRTDLWGIDRRYVQEAHPDEVAYTNARVIPHAIPPEALQLIRPYEESRSWGGWPQLVPLTLRRELDEYRDMNNAWGIGKPDRVWGSVRSPNGTRVGGPPIPANPIPANPIPVQYHAGIDPLSFSGNAQGYPGRWPVIWDGQTLHMGPEGSTHDQVGAASGYPTLESRRAEGWIGPNPEAGDDEIYNHHGQEFGWYGNPSAKYVPPSVSRRMLEYHRVFNRPTIDPNAEGGYGHGYRLAADSSMQWQPGQWGKGVILDGQPHTWPTVNSGTDFMGSPHHGGYLRDRGVDIWSSDDWDRWHDPIVIGPEGHYVVNDSTNGEKTIEPTRFARTYPGMKYVTDEDKWRRRVSHKHASEDSPWRLAAPQYPMGFGTMYHVSPRKNRESILQHGLQGHEQGRRENSPWNYTWDQPAGNYMFDDLENAHDYIYNMHSRTHRLPEQPNWEDKYTWPEPPEDFHNWPDEEQENWHDEQEPTERTDDPNGYDIYRVQTHGLPIAPDPETSVTNEDEQWDLGRIYDVQRGKRRDNWGNPRELSDWGNEPVRYYVPQAIHPSRVQLHDHVPSWNLTQEENQDRLDDTSQREFPDPWSQVPLTERPMPGHEGKQASPQGGSWAWGDPREFEPYYETEYGDELGGRGLISPHGMLTWNHNEPNGPSHGDMMNEFYERYPGTEVPYRFNLDPDGAVWWAKPSVPSALRQNLLLNHPHLREGTGDAPMPYSHGESLSKVASPQGGSWDPLICTHCGGPMTESTFYGGHWMNQCTHCGRSRQVPNSSPLLQQKRQQEELQPYPELLQGVGPQRPWTFASKRSDLYHVAPRGRLSDAGAQGQSWEGKLWHGSNRGHLGPVRPGFFATTHKPEAEGFAGIGPDLDPEDQGAVHPVSMRFKRPAFYFGSRPFDAEEQAKANGNDGIVVHYPEDLRDPSDPMPARQWAYAIDPGTVTPGHETGYVS